MNYKRFVSQGSSAFGVYEKRALDLAALLDNPLFAYPENPDEWSMRNTVRIREPLYNELCAIYHCASVVPMPPYEPEFFKAPLMREAGEQAKSEASRLRAIIHQTIHTGYGMSDSHASNVCDALGIILDEFPWIFEGCRNLGKEEIVAKLNELFKANELPPIRPDFTNWKMAPALAMNPPPLHITIVIVDDEKEKLAQTAAALAGWSNVSTLLYHHNRDREWTNKKMEPGAKMELVAREINALEPDVIIMDEGLDSKFEGHELVLAVAGTDERSLQFVANTGGNDGKLRGVGTFPNCNKGEKLNYIVDAIRECVQLKQQ